MPIAQAPFRQAEYDRRIAKTRRAMAAAGIDLLFVTDPSNQAWLTGYDGWSFYVHQGVILTLEGAPVWWGRMQDTQGARRTVWMGEDQVQGYDETYVQNPAAHPMAELAGRFVDAGQARAHIGVEMDNYYYSARAHAVLTARLPNARFVDATGMVNWQRAEKSAAEIDFMRKAARISDKIIALALDKARPGLRKNHLIGDIVQAAYHGVDDTWGDYPAIVPLAPSGADAAAPHLTWNGDELRAGEGTFFELAGCYRRYHAPLCRTVFLGQPPRKMRDAAARWSPGLKPGSRWRAPARSPAMSRGRWTLN